MDDGQPLSDITPAEVNAMLGPIVMGDMTAILLYGILLSSFHRFLHSSSWSSASQLMRSTILFVMAATTAVTALFARDLYLNSTTVVKTLESVAGGDVPEAVQIPLLGIIAATVQVVLVLRASRVIRGFQPRKRAAQTHFRFADSLHSFGRRSSTSLGGDGSTSSRSAP
ncbi:hypothetical protein BCR35DRAFT_27747 [Leucosporidium creatinivorum]|uniref:Uncharacterized protein n=1 Tax=Leucosporidium creatinivorum TaxID=106004 RepID=A0A1Y2CKQ5_9BASI|nr:hypothetical protein BCR35DRAFT_27747 [Leucosporidium creatinivorum]